MNSKTRPVCLAMLVAANSALGQIIDFESIPGLPAPVDGMVISNQFALPPYGVSFRYEGGGFPYLAATGGVRTAFSGVSQFGTRNDMPDFNQGIGKFFLTDGNVDLATSDNPPPSPLIIEYSQPVAGASGVIIDVVNDRAGTEVWLLEARDSNSVTVATNIISSKSFNSGNGRATPWSFSRGAADIHSIRISFLGTKSISAGFAFDNFSVSSVELIPPALSITVTQGIPNIEINGTIGSTNRIEYLSMPAGTNWLPLVEVILTDKVEVIQDLTATNAAQRFYRTITLR